MMQDKRTLLRAAFPVSLTVAAMVLLGACAGGASAPSPSSTTPAGASIYTKNCGACHGLNGEGTTAGPAIAGHSVASTEIQVRSPMGTMPPFTASQMSDADLDAVAEFIARMAPMASSKDWEEASGETIHLWMALLAIASDDANDARHHLNDVLAVVKDGERRASTEEAIGLIDRGNLHDAEHEIEEMAGSSSPSGISMKRFHLVLAQRAAEAEDAAEIRHHLTVHFMTLATEAEKGLAGEAVELADRGDFHEAEHEIEEMMAAQP